MTTSSTASNTEQKDINTLNASALRISLSARSLQSSLEWYRDVVGFVVTARHEREEILRAISLAAGSAEIVISQDDGAKGADRVKGQGISLNLPTSQNVDAIATSIKARGGVLESEPADTPWGGRAFRLRDPDGFMLVISSERTQ